MREQLSSLPNFIKRFISGLFLIPLTVALILAGSLWTTGMMILIALGLSYEWMKLANFEKTKKALFFYGIILGSIGAYTLWGIRMSGALLLSTSTFFYYCVSRFQKHQTEKLAPWFFWGMLYVGIPSLSFLWVRDHSEHGGLILIWALCVIWASDIGAYYIGTWVGGPKLAPHISPKKTWSGFFGGLFLAVLVGISGGLWIGLENLSVLVGMTIGISILGVLGDLLESALKRFWGVKDSGSLIPGHGGLLDRLDSILIVLPALAVSIAFLGAV